MVGKTVFESTFHSISINFFLFVSSLGQPLIPFGVASDKARPHSGYTSLTISYLNYRLHGPLFIDKGTFETFAYDFLRP